MQHRRRVNQEEEYKDYLEDIDVGDVVFVRQYNEVIKLAVTPSDNEDLIRCSKYAFSRDNGLTWDSKLQIMYPDSTAKDLYVGCQERKRVVNQIEQMWNPRAIMRAPLDMLHDLQDVLLDLAGLLKQVPK